MWVKVCVFVAVLAYINHTLHFRHSYLSVFAQSKVGFDFCAPNTIHLIEQSQWYIFPKTICLVFRAPLCTV